MPGDESLIPKSGGDVHVLPCLRRLRHCVWALRYFRAVGSCVGHVR